jgi:hypothetical protein
MKKLLVAFVLLSLAACTGAKIEHTYPTRDAEDQRRLEQGGSLSAEYNKARGYDATDGFVLIGTKK